MEIGLVFTCTVCGNTATAHKYFPSSTDPLYHLPVGWATSNLRMRAVLCPNCWFMKDQNHIPGSYTLVPSL